MTTGDGMKGAAGSYASPPCYMHELDPDFAGVPIVLKRQDDVALNCVMSNSFGFGGTNATLVFRRHDA